MMGIGHSVPKDFLMKAVRSVHKYNFDFEYGLLNATYPKGKQARFKTHQNLQAAGNWTGIEYANAALMIEIGMVAEGLEVVRSVHQRYVRSGRRWNHVECGDHYFRAMSSWTTLLALTGFRLDAPKRTVTFGPKSDEMVAPWFAPTGYGMFGSHGRSLEITCRTGRLGVETLRIETRAESATVKINERSISATVARHEDYLEIKLSEEIQIVAGDSCHVTLQ